ncbi:MAG: carbon-nitrogen hydrolase family protein [Burkholderiales bacterium]|jgi:nitrilase|nr:carbon-nitrogen hydrolase family protein [Burkholderiales bacterium]
MENDLRNMKIAAVQMVSGMRLDKNLSAAQRLIGEAVEQGAELILLPEYFGSLGASLTDRRRLREQDNDGAQQRFLAETAKKHHIWLVGGCVPIIGNDPDRSRSACLVYNPNGERIARYDKIHLFRFSYGDEAYDEADLIEAGDIEPVAFDAPCGRVALSICYDLRFPELYRALASSPDGITLILMPAAFTYTTGRAHWEVLLRARAIENQCYVLAAAQGGVHENGRQTFGCSMLINPWGEIVNGLAEGEGVVCAEINIEQMLDARARLPALKHRRLTHA